MVAAYRMRLVTLVIVLLLGIFSAGIASAQQQYNVLASTPELQESRITIEGRPSKALVLPFNLGVSLHFKLVDLWVVSAASLLIIVTLILISKPRISKRNRGLATATYIGSLLLAASAFCVLAAFIPNEFFAWVLGAYAITFQEFGVRFLAPAVIGLAIIRQFWGIEKRLLMLSLSTLIYTFSVLVISTLDPIMSGLYAINVLMLAIPHFRSTPNRTLGTD